MDNNLNMDQQFREAFRQWEAPHSHAEMHADWSQVSAHLPQAPVPHAPPKAPVWSAGKLLTLGGTIAGGTVAAILIYSALNQKPAIIEKNRTTPLEQFSSTQKEEIKIQDISPLKISESEDKITTENHRKSITATEKSRKVNEAEQVSGFPEQKEITASANASAGQIQQPDNKPEGQRQFEELTANHDAIRRQDLGFSDTVTCAGNAIILNNTSSLSGDNARIEWGDGYSSKLSDAQSHTYTAPGTYKVSVRSGIWVVKQNLTIEAAPSATFTSRCDGLNCAFRNTSPDGATYRWDFGDGSAPQLGYSAEHRYSDTGHYRVTLSGFTRGGCSSSVVRDVYIHPLPVIPNIITPDGDGKNDEWVIGIENTSYYSVAVYSGDKEVFRTEDHNRHWNGRDKKGQPCLPGTYYYLLKYKYRGDSEMQQQKGTLEIR